MPNEDFSHKVSD